MQNFNTSTSPLNIKQKHRSAQLEQLIMKNMCISCGIFSTVVIVSIIYYICSQGLAVFNEFPAVKFFTSSYWSPTENEYGVLPFITGTFILTFLSVAIGGIVGIAGAVFMAKIAPKKLRKLLRMSIDVFVGIPSVVYGYIGITVLVPIIVKIFPDSSGFGFLPASIILGIMILPTIINISEDSIRSIDISMEEASYAMGATRWQTIYKVLIPIAAPGIISGIILGMARALGETMAVLMVIGNAPQLTADLITPTSVLTTAIVMDMAGVEFGTAWSNALFMMATILLIISLLLIAIIRFVIRRESI